MTATAEDTAGGEQRQQKSLPDESAQDRTSRSRNNSAREGVAAATPATAAKRTITTTADDETRHRLQISYRG